ncbi:uncharacterized protein BX664DRAFT_388473 [Halteromyces radiatus]|uniref:uncharacterized protein n=1 Tax=Halteromyces radiatus TaxID=101107 RepID=UPI00221EDE3F|nr:uncharacterized protein BX664DRAFT_388473 [Halteromyces radiatus]KAI8081498.1 hypothetical protein BX664DRAFT_388473 [Halteromyces radiatus]
MDQQKPMSQPYAPGVPPPTYQQQGDRPGQTYYQPPPNAGGAQQQYYPPHVPPSNLQSRFVNFYNPPQNNRLGIKRKILSMCCCILLIAVIVGLAAGLTTRSYSSYGTNGSSYCRTNNDCYNQYGSGVYCYNGYCSR